MGEAAIRERVRVTGKSGRGYADRVAQVDLRERLHLLPIAPRVRGALGALGMQGTPPAAVAGHELSPNCWCEPEPCFYTPEAAFPGERYDGWYHHEAN